MSLSKSIAKNTIIHALGKFSAAAIGVVTIGLVTRYLGTEGYGYYTTIFAYLFFFGILADLGLYLITVTELGRHETDKQKLFSNIFTMRFCSAIVLMFIASIIIWLFPYPEVIKIGVLIGTISIVFSLSDQILVALFQSKMKMIYTSLAEFLTRLLMLGLTYLVVTKNLGFNSLLWLVAIIMFLHFMIDYTVAKRMIKFKFAFDFVFWRKVLKKSWPVATYMIFSMIYFKADTIILSLFYSQSTVGIYGAPYKILESLIAFPAVFMGLIIPHISSAWSEKNIDKFKKYFQQAFDSLSLIVWPMVFGAIVLAKPIMVLIAGTEFSASAIVLRLLIIATGIIFLAHLTTFSVVALEKQRVMLKYYILAAVSALVLYFIFIPKYSYYAAGTITVLVEFFILLTSWLLVKKTTHIKINFKNNLKALLASIIMSATLLLTNFGLFVNLILGVIIYIICIYLLGALKKEFVVSFIKK